MCEWIHECCLWACLCVSECVSTFLGEWMCQHLCVFAYIMWEWLCRLFVWDCSLVNIFVSMSTCEWMYDYVCVWKVVFGNVSELMGMWLYVWVWVSMFIVYICEYICACDFVHMQVKCDKWLCFYTHTHHTYECVSLCMHVNVLEKTFEHVQVSMVECVNVCDCLCVSERATMLVCKWTHEHIHLC